MSPHALIIHVDDTERGAQQAHVFSRSPVRVGRSPRNDLPLDHSFVSHCHGLFHFDESQVEFVDVGSTNGSFLEGQRLARNLRVTVSEGSRVAIGALRLSARHQRDAAGDCGHETTQARRTAQLNQQFAQSFLELRRGQQQLLRALGLELRCAGPLHSLETASALLTYLLDASAPPERLEELGRAHTELMRHELALVSAIRGGARELLDELAPGNVAPDGFGGVGNWVARMFGRDVRWLALARKFSELHEETALSAVVLGRGFARAYTAALERSTEPPPAAARATRSEP